MSISDFYQQHVKDIKPSTNGWHVGLCPLHDDRKSSFTFEEKTGNWSCHAGCGKGTMKTFADRLGVPAPSNGNGTGKEKKGFGRIVKTYDYHDETGALSFQACRMEPKDFRQRKPDGAGGWSWSMKGVTRVPYHLPDVLKADKAYIAEGEKDCDNLQEHGLTATCNPMGAGKWRAEYSRYFRNKTIIILPDNDEPGRAHALQVAAALHEVARSIKIVDLPGLPAKGDVSDWLQAGGTIEELNRLTDQAKPFTGLQSKTEVAGLPVVIVAGCSIISIAEQIGPLMAATGRYYARAGGIAEIVANDDGAPEIAMLKPAAAITRMESVAILVDDKGKIDRITEQDTKTIILSEIFQKALPPLHQISPCPVLIERAGKLIPVSGYDKESGIYATGHAPQDMNPEEARQILQDVLSDFRFVSDGDRARALAALITPALIFGGHIRGRAPLFTLEADESQTGKGYFNKVTAAIYGRNVITLAQRKGGVGSIDEGLSRGLLSGAGFIALDNLRGKIDLPSLESLLTEDVYLCRVPYQGDVPINPKRAIFLCTSNRCEFTPDLANRACIIRLKKQPEGYNFRHYPAGSLIDDIRGRQGLYLGAVFSILRAWHAAGKPRSSTANHDFRAWASTLNWIGQNLLGAGELMQGHEVAKQRTANSSLSWLRDVALHFIKCGLSEWVRAHEILDAIIDTDIEIPGMTGGDNPDDDDTRRRILQAIGKRLNKTFKSVEKIEIDGIACERSTDWNEERRKDDKIYRFTPGPEKVKVLRLEDDFAPGEHISIRRSEKDEEYQIIAGQNNQFCAYAPEGGNNFKYQIFDDEEKNKKDSEPSGAPGAHQAQSCPEACRDCERLRDGEHCRMYDKPAGAVMYCLKKEKYEQAIQ